MDNNQEPIKPDNILPSDEQHLMNVDQNHDLVPSNKSGNIIIGTLNLVANPAKKLVVHPLRRRYHRHYHPRHRWGKHHLVADIILASTVIVLLVITGIAYWQNRIAGRLPLEISITSNDTEIVTGSPAAFTINYKYTGEETVPQAKLLLHLPKLFELTSVESRERWNQNSLSWNLGPLIPKAKGNLEIKGIFWSTPKSVQTIAVQLIGEGQEYSSASQTFYTERTVLEIKSKIASTIILRQPSTLEWVISNNSSTNVGDLLVAVEYPQGWKTTGTQPITSGNRLSLPQLAAGTSTTVSINGAFESLPSNPAFLLSLYSKRSGDEVLFSTNRADTTLLDPALELSARLTSPGSINPGDKVSVVVSYYNRGEFSLEDLNILAIIKGPYVAPNSIQATNGITKENQASWDKTTLTQLASIVPDQHGELILNFTTSTTTDLTKLSPLDSLSITIEPRAEFKTAILPTTMVKWPGDGTNVAINSQLSLNAQARYFTTEGEQIGRGPLPPRVGKETKYWLSLNLNNTIHDVYETVVTINLPDNITFTGQTSVTQGDALRFSPTTHKVQWTIGRLDHFLGINPPIVSANLELAIKPTINNLGKEMPLMLGAEVQGVDVVTKNKLTADTTFVTTDLPNDNRGRVMP